MKNNVDNEKWGVLREHSSKATGRDPLTSRDYEPRRALRSGAPRELSLRERLSQQCCCRNDEDAKLCQYV